MGPLLHHARLVFGLLACALLAPGAFAQITASPSSIERTTAAGEETTASFSITNTGSEAADYLLRIRDASGARSASGASDAFARIAPSPNAALGVRPARDGMTPPQRIDLRSALAAESAGATARGFATDSIFYDNGDEFPDSFLGTNDAAVPLFAAQRFTPAQRFDLDAVRLFATSLPFDETAEASDLAIRIEVYDAPNEFEPRAGTLLATAEGGLDAGSEGFVDIALIESITFAAGEDFFVVAMLAGAPFPIGFDYTGDADAAFRSFASLDGEPGTWIATEDIVFDSAPFLIRALSGSATSNGWLTATPSSGTLAAGETATVDLTLNARSLFAGTYGKVVEVIERTTGLVTPVSVTLTVTGEGAVTLSTPFVDLEEVAVGSAGGQTITVINAGSAPLTITGFSSTDPALTAFGLRVGETLIPGTESFFAVRFAPTEPGPFSGTLTIITDAGEASVDVVAVGFSPPEAVVSPGSFAVSLAPGATSAFPLSIENTGGTGLFYSATVRGAAGATSDSLFYDNGDEFSDSFLGTGVPDVPLFTAQRFTAETAFDLRGLRLYVNTFPFESHFPDSTGQGDASGDLGILAEVYTAPDPFNPEAGDLLATAGTIVPAEDEGSEGFVEITMDGALSFEPGASFFVIVRLAGNAFPIGIDDNGTGDFEGRTFFALSRDEWIPSMDYLGDGLPDAALLRALSGSPGQRLVSVAPARGTIEAGADTTLTVTFNATEIELGTYEQVITLRTNDPMQPEITIPVTVVVEGQGVMPLTNGWNLVSWNVQLDDMRLEAALASVWDQVEQVQLYRDDRWTTYDLTAMAEADAQLRPGEAIWVKLSAAANLTMDGPSMAMEAMPLNAGLNAVAYLPSEANATAHAFAGIMEATESIQSFHSTGVAYAPGVPEAFQTLERVQPGMGYLVQATAPVRLEYPLVAAQVEFAGVPTSALVAAEREAGVSPTPAWVSVWSENLELTAGTLVTAVDPDGVVCGAFRVQTDGALGLMAIYGDDPTTDTDEGAVPGDRITLRTDAGIVSDELVWTYPGSVLEVNSIVVSNEEQGGLPASFALHGGYPNPFANATTVGFDLPQASDVQLEVFDSTGRRVATLLNETFAAGSHSTTWDANRMASGLYLVVLRAGDFVATQRAVVLR